MYRRRIQSIIAPPTPRQGPTFYSGEADTVGAWLVATLRLGRQVTSILAALCALGGLALTAFLVLFLVELIDTYRRRRRHYGD